MAKTSYSIYMDYQKAIKQAEKLDRVVADIKKEKLNLAECRKMISSAWKGENATAYLNKIKKVSDDLNRMVKNLSDTAETIRKVAKINYQAEKKAIEIAEERKYKG